MLGFFAPRKENKNSVANILPESPTSYVTTVTERRDPYTPASTTTAQIAKPRPAIRSSLAVGGSVYPGWHEPPHLTKTPWELERHKKQSRSKTADVQFPAKVFENLPKEVYGTIIAQLELLHLDEAQACSACYLRDLHSLSLTSRAWDKATIIPMYRKVLLFTNEDHAKLPKLKIRGISRLKLVRRTLRSRPAIARYVRELHIPDFQALYQNAAIEQEEIVSLVASLVMACPNLERLVGFHVPLSPRHFDRLSHALARKAKLNQKTWILKEHMTDLSDEEEEEDSLSRYYLRAYDPTERFLDLNSNHAQLSTLVLHQEDSLSSTSLNFRAIIGTLRQLPNLRALSVSGLSESSFTNLTLNALPRNLRSLRLQNLAGIDDRGLQRFASSPSMNSIENLLLVDIDISVLTTISNILSAHSAQLDTFTFIQYSAPKLSTRKSIPLEFHSRTLRRLHWEIRSDAGPLPVLPSTSPLLTTTEEPSFPFRTPEPISCLATSLLATSIENGAFPSLRRIRIPHDPQGLVQALCKPLATALLPCDMTALTSPTNMIGNIANLQAKPRADSAIGFPTLSTGFTRAISSPTHSRLAAQARILAARKNALMTLQVHDPNNKLKIERVIGGFIGQVSSQITYDLRADVYRTSSFVAEEAEVRNEWITNIEDLMGEHNHDVLGTRERLSSACGHRNQAKPALVEDLFR